MKREAGKYYKTRNRPLYDQSLSAWQGGIFGNRKNMRLYHFVTRSRLQQLAAVVGKPSLATYNAYGEFIHAQEDTFAHSDCDGGRDFNYYGNFFGMAENGGIYGHGPHGHDPDHTWKDITKAMKMAERMFTNLKQIHDGRFVPGNADNDDVPIEPAFESIRQTVFDFVRYEPNVQATFAVITVVEDVTFSGYNKKIALLGKDDGDPLHFSAGMNPAYKAIYHEVTGIQTGTFWSTVINSIGNNQIDSPGSSDYQ